MVLHAPAANVVKMQKRNKKFTRLKIQPLVIVMTVVFCDIDDCDEDILVNMIVD